MNLPLEIQMLGHYITNLKAYRIVKLNHLQGRQPDRLANQDSYRRVPSDQSHLYWLAQSSADYPNLSKTDT